MNMSPMRSSHRDIEDFGAGPSPRRSASASGNKIWQYVTAVLVIVVLVTVPILFVMIANVKTSSQHSYMGSTSTFTAASGSSIAGGNAVSLDSSGVLQAGAGTSIYRNIVDIVATCPKYLNMDAISDDAYLISYSDGQTTSLQVVTVDAATPNRGTVVQTETVQQTIADMVTLSKSTGLFVGICQDQEVAATQDYIVAGFVDPVTHAISPLIVSDEYAVTYSVMPVITRLSDTAFAIAYTKAVTPQLLMTRYGQVDVTNNKIVLSAEVEFVVDSSYAHYFDVVGLTAKSYALLFYNGNATAVVDQWYGGGPLQARYATVIGADVTLSATTTLSGAEAMPIFSLASTRISDTSAVVTFADYNHNFGINTQLIYVKDGVIGFGSSLLLSNAPSLGLADGVMMDLDIELTSDDGKFMVLYSDASNNFAMTATTAQVTASQEIERTSPDFLLNSGDASTDSKYSWGALAAGSSAPLAGRTGILSSVTNTKCTIPPTVNFALMETLPGLYGTTTPTTTTSFGAGSAVDVITTGVQSGWSSAGRAPLTTGTVYYTNTMGKVMKSSTFYGHEADDTAGYFYDAASDTIVTSAGRVGYAASADALYVDN